MRFSRVFASVVFLLSIFVAIANREGELVYTTSELRRHLTAQPQDRPTPP